MAELYRDQLYDTVPTPNKKKLNTAEATANSNEPTGKRVFPQYVEDRYQDLEINTSYKYNPETSICATYLWTENIGYPKDLVTATAEAVSTGFAPFSPFPGCWASEQPQHAGYSKAASDHQQNIGTCLPTTTVSTIFIQSSSVRLQIVV